MRAKISCFLFLLVWLFGHSSSAQSILGVENFRLDSLQRVLALARNDTDKIRLKYQTGRVSKIRRIGYWDSLLVQARSHKMVVYEYRTMAALGLVYHYAQQSPKALEYMTQSFLIAEGRNDKNETEAELQDIFYFCHNADVKNLDLCYKALKLAEKIGDKQLVIEFYSAIALHSFFQKDYSKSLALHFKCLKLSKGIDYHRGIVDGLIDIGSDYYALGDTDKAVQYYLATREYASEFEGTFHGADIYMGMAAAYNILNLPDSGYKYGHKSYEIGLRLNKSIQAGAMVVMAHSLRLKGDFEGEKKMCIDAIALSRSIGFMVQIPDIALNLKKIYLKEKNYKKALEAYELYVNVRDSIVNEKNRKQSLEKEFAYTFEKKENENTLLAKQNQIQSLELNQTKYILTGVAGLLLLVVVIGYLFFRQRKTRTEQQSLQLEQKLLRSQMNPHFIFNSLNSIQQFIISRQNDRAELYLSKFSKLVRELLESNTKESLSVREEADILRGYLEMEALRFRRAFSFQVTVDEKIEQDQSQIPHMMIQPFVENAIWHGLLPKEGERNLLVAFEACAGKTVRCVVDDDGVGREKSMGKETTFKKKSLALSFIKQRIRLMRKTLKVDCSVEIIDKTDDTGQSTGTRVIIVLPIINKQHVKSNSY